MAQNTLVIMQVSMHNSKQKRCDWSKEIPAHVGYKVWSQYWEEAKPGIIDQSKIQNFYFELFIRFEI